MRNCYNYQKIEVLVVCLAGCAVVSVFGSGGKKVLEIVFGVTYVLSVQYSCAVVSVFLLWRESIITTGKKKVLVVWRESFNMTGKKKF